MLVLPLIAIECDEGVNFIEDKWYSFAKMCVELLAEMDIPKSSPWT